MHCAMQLQEFIEKIGKMKMDVANKAKRELRSELQRLSTSPLRFGVVHATQTEFRRSLRAFYGDTGQRWMSLFASFNHQDDNVIKLVKGALVLMRRDVDDIHEWQDVRKEFNNGFYETLLALDFTAANTNSKVWKKALDVTEGIDYISLLRSNEAVRAMLRWFEGAKFLHMMAVDIADEMWEVEHREILAKVAQRRVRSALQATEAMEEAAKKLQNKSRGVAATKKVRNELRPVSAFRASAKVDTGQGGQPRTAGPISNPVTPRASKADAIFTPRANQFKSLFNPASAPTTPRDSRASKASK